MTRRKHVLYLMACNADTGEVLRESRNEVDDVLVANKVIDNWIKSFRKHMELGDHVSLAMTWRLRQAEEQSLFDDNSIF